MDGPREWLPTDKKLGWSATRMVTDWTDPERAVVNGRPASRREKPTLLLPSGAEPASAGQAPEASAEAAAVGKVRRALHDDAQVVERSAGVPSSVQAAGHAAGHEIDSRGRTRASAARRPKVRGPPKAQGERTTEGPR
jgi:hypothetical protein